MGAKTYQMTIGGETIDVVRKNVKNINIRIYPPSGKVRVAVPLSISDDMITQVVVKKLEWIKRQKAKFRAQLRPETLRMVSGETLYFLGSAYQLRIFEHSGLSHDYVELRNNAYLDLYIRPDIDTEQRKKLLQEWYRKQLRLLIPPIIEKWQPVLGVEVLDWRIRRMKTRWGSCNIQAQRIWLNLELAKKPVQCLEYVVVHEMMHLLERYHNDRFTALMDRHLPEWRLHRGELNVARLPS